MIVSILLFSSKYPMEPQYTPLRLFSSSLIISIDLIFGAPVIEPPGKQASKIFIEESFLLRSPYIVLTI